MNIVRRNETIITVINFKLENKARRQKEEFERLKEDTQELICEKGI